MVHKDKRISTFKSDKVHKKIQQVLQFGFKEADSHTS